LRAEARAGAGPVVARALIESSDVARADAGGQAGERVVDAGVELEPRREVADGRSAAQVVVARRRDGSPRAQGLPVVDQIGRVEEEPELAEAGREAVPESEVDPAGLCDADILLDVHHVGDASFSRLAMDESAVRVIAVQVTAVEDVLRTDRS